MIDENRIIDGKHYEQSESVNVIGYTFNILLVEVLQKMSDIRNDYKKQWTD